LRRTEELLGKGKAVRARNCALLLLLSAAATILMIRPSSVFWEHLPKLRFVQFPWRWMAILAVPYGYFLAAAVERQRRVWLWAVAVIVVIGGTASFLVRVRGGIPKTSRLAGSDLRRTRVLKVQTNTIRR